MASSSSSSFSSPHLSRSLLPNIQWHTQTFSGNSKSRSGWPKSYFMPHSQPSHKGAFCRLEKYTMTRLRNLWLTVVCLCEDVVCVCVSVCWRCIQTRTRADTKVTTYTAAQDFLSSGLYVLHWLKNIVTTGWEHLHFCYVDIHCVPLRPEPLPFIDNHKHWLHLSSTSKGQRSLSRTSVGQWATLLW